MSPNKEKLKRRPSVVEQLKRSFEGKLDSQLDWWQTKATAEFNAAADDLLAQFPDVPLKRALLQLKNTHSCATYSCCSYSLCL